MLPMPWTFHHLPSVRRSQLLKRTLASSFFAVPDAILPSPKTGRRHFVSRKRSSCLGGTSERLSKGARIAPSGLAVGVADVVPKLVAAKLLEPAVAVGVRLICREGRPANLLADLALHLLDVVLLDAPVGPQSRIRAFSHALASTSLNVVGAREWVERYREGYPESLDGAPFLFPTHDRTCGRYWTAGSATTNLRPNIVGSLTTPPS